MSDERNAADRVRPFLQRMEQSILAARHRRLHGTDEPVPVAPPQQVPPAAPPSEPVVGQTQRLRARPKRAASPFPGYEEPHIQSRAG